VKGVEGSVGFSNFILRVHSSFQLEYGGVGRPYTGGGRIRLYYFQANF